MSLHLGRFHVRASHSKPINLNLFPNDGDVIDLATLLNYSIMLIENPVAIKPTTLPIYNLKPCLKVIIEEVVVM